MFINATTRQQISVFQNWHLLACTPHLEKWGVQKNFFARSARESCFVRPLLESRRRPCRQCHTIPMDSSSLLLPTISAIFWRGHPQRERQKRSWVGYNRRLWPIYRYVAKTVQSYYRTCTLSNGGISRDLEWPLTTPKPPHFCYFVSLFVSL